jgi:hypothetical protein
MTHVQDGGEINAFAVFSKLRAKVVEPFQIECFRSYIDINGHRLDLLNRPKLALLLNVMWKSGSVSTEVLMSKVYGIHKDHSDRNQRSQHHNLIKLISRGRVLLAHLSSSIHVIPSVHWMYYDAVDKKWSLYRLRLDPKTFQDLLCVELSKGSFDFMPTVTKRDQNHLAQQPAVSF